MNVTIQPDCILVNGNRIDQAPRLQACCAAFNARSGREKAIFDQGKPWRKFLFFDEEGITLLYDVEIDRVLDVHFCLAPTSTEPSPKSVFSGLLFLNGSRLVAGMAESALPVRGEFPLIKQGGWRGEGDGLFVHLRLSSKTKKLADASVTFLRRPRFASEGHTP